MTGSFPDRNRLDRCGHHAGSRWGRIAVGVRRSIGRALPRRKSGTCGDVPPPGAAAPFALVARRSSSVGTHAPLRYGIS